MILGTAGHVDHGKTSLVKALTGIDTDRLPEEKRRGITLELGFAHLALPSGRALGVVDVPGHERFVKAMAAGAGGVDVAMLVVASDEGVMPQTREHLDICQLLGVRAGVVVLTKADLLPGLGDEWQALVREDIAALVKDSFLEDAPVLGVSSKSGEGLPLLLAALDRLCADLPERSADGPLFLPIDRAFTMKGFGCVVTGTLLSGKVAVEDAVRLVPAFDDAVRVRGVQAHGSAVPLAVAGGRVALNLSGVDTAQVQRGMAVVREGELSEVGAVDVDLSLLPSVPAPLGRRSRHLVTVGTALVQATVHLLGVEQLEPGARCFAQLRFSRKVAALPGQRFILRGTRALEGRGATVGGGVVLSLDPPKRRRGEAPALEALAKGTLDERLLWLLGEAGSTGLEAKALKARASAPPKDVDRALEALSAKGRVVLVDKESRRYLLGRVVEALVARARKHVEATHAASADKAGMPREELRQRLGLVADRTFQRVLQAAVDGKALELVGELLRVPGREVQVDERTSAEKDAVLQLLEQTDLAPPTLSDLAWKLKLDEARTGALCKALVAEGRAVRAGELCFSAAAIARLEAKLRAHFEANPSLTTQAFKELTGQSRKYVIPLAEYFDREKVTLRVGEARVLRKAGK